MGHPFERTWSVKVDRTKPTLGVTWDPDVSGEQLWEDEYRATLRATDSSSGVQRAELLVDGERVRDDHLFERTSGCDGCPLTHTFALRPEDLSPGPHTITIEVKDFAGNPSDAQSWNVQVGSGGERSHYGFDTFAGDDALTAKVNIASGNLLVRSNDVIDPEMALDRFYNSASAGRSGAFGNGWTASLGQDVRLHEAPDGSITYYGPSHYALRFTRNADGSYASPVHFAGTLSRAGDGTFVVDDRVSGDLLEFPSATSSVHAVTDGSGNTTSVTYNEDGSINSFEDNYERVTTFASGGGDVISIMDPDDVNDHSYTYALGRLQSSTNRAGQTTVYGYDAQGRLNEITLPDGVRLAITYTDETKFRVASVTRYPSGATTGETTTYTYSDGQTIVTRPTGVAVYRHDQNFQVYTSDSHPPVVTQPFGYGDEPSNTDGGYANGVGTYDLDVAVDDPGSGVRRVWLERVGVGTVDDRTTSCSTLPGNVGFVSVCPPRYESTIPIDTSQLPEGGTTFRLNASDGAGNSDTYPTFDLLIDRTAPPGPEISVLEAFDEADLGEAVVGWEFTDDDPDLPTGQPGAGIAAVSYRYHVNSGSWSEWRSTADTDEGLTATIHRVADGDTIHLESRTVDGVGNMSATISSSLVVAQVSEDPDESGTLPAGSSTFEVTKRIRTEGETDAEDETHAAAHALIVLESDATGQRAIRVTDDDGVARFPDIAAGTYKLSFTDGSVRSRSVSATSGETSREEHTISRSRNDTFHRGDRALRSFCLNPDHNKMCDLAGEDAGAAQHWTETEFTEPQARSDDTKANAFTHAIWGAMMVRSFYRAGIDKDYWYFVRKILTWNESEASKSKDLTVRRSVRQDFHNNPIGYRTGRRHHKHNDEWFCNHMRHRVRAGGLFRYRWGTAKWPRGKAPRRYQLTWWRKNHITTGNRVFMTRVTRCGDPP